MGLNLAFIVKKLVQFLRLLDDFHLDMVIAVAVATFCFFQLIKGGFQLLDLIIPQLKSHVIPYKFTPLIG